MKELYNTNVCFREYVDKYCKTHGMCVEDAFKSVLVKGVYCYYTNKKVEDSYYG